MCINRRKILILGFILSILLFFSHPQRVFAEIINGSWSSTTNLTNQTASHVSTSEGGRLFMFGGANIDDFSEVYSSLINSDGSLSAWTVVSNLPETRFWGALVKKEKRLYILGGAMFTGTTNYKNTVYSATIQLDGSLSSWQSLSSLPENRALGKAVIIGDRIYYAGGFNNSGAQDEVYYADINPDGTLGPWTTSSVSLPEPLFGFGMVEHEGNIIVFGGFNGSVFRNKAYRASVNPDGTISTWTETSALSEPVYRGSSIRIGSTLISVAGHNGSNFLNKVYYTEINSDGTLDPWKLSSNTLPQGLNGAAISYANGFMYVTGGFNGSYLDTVYYAPVSQGINLPVPLLKQTNPLWGGFTYDSANVWAPPSGIDISTWGCAMTSAAMVFRFHKITKLPDGTDLNPGTLNDWLNSQPDGYIPNGQTNWWAIARLSVLAKSQNPEFIYKSLEYKKIKTEDKDQLKSDIENNMPGILEEPGHFIVGRGINENGIFTINDPAYDRTDLSSYNNSFITLGRYIPSNSDLSYIVLATNSNVQLNLKDSNGNNVGEAFTQQPLVNDTTGVGTSGPPLAMLDLPKPTSGDYQIGLSSNSVNNHQLDVYLYDVDGNVKVAHSTGIVGPGDADLYSIQFNKDNSNNSSSNQNITFDSFIADINSLYNLGEINFPNRVLLLVQAKVAKKLAGNNFTKKASINILKALDKKILRAKGKGVSNNAYNILHNDIQSLLASLSP